MKRPESIDLDALRTFVVGIDLGNFTLAANQLCRSTSAVSAQLKKLEQQCGVKLLSKSGRNLRLTESGELLLSYGKKMLSINDEALQAIQQQTIHGAVSIGLQEDFSERLLPNLLGRIARSFPNIQIYAQCGRNNTLKEESLHNKIDFALCWENPLEMNQERLITEVPQHWIASPSFDLSSYLSSGKPLPLILLEAPCIIRDAAIKILDQENIPWKIAVSGGSLSGIWGAVNAGLGITVRTDLGIPNSLAVIHHELPKLPTIGLSLLESSLKKEKSQILIKELLLDELQRYIFSFRYDEKTKGSREPIQP
ncbi:LysR family transcriptional regulator [Photobacterium sp. 53610]|uniref:LysR family transcriptional regulator n=1 Tax=Photobacterium sp. 53610 TaxID=3102789 RepID=UPI002EDA74C3